MQLEAVVGLFGDVQAVELLSWVERGWVHAESGQAGWEFHEIDIARVRLIRDLRREMDVTEDAVPLVLSLLDQVYDLRRTLRRLAKAVERQPPEIRTNLMAAFGNREGQAP